ncbi:hypothetical protein R1sor_020431 [Riccia sorocarpa]|uniref:Uncharacterized protein n=1 Tax=Riccia sorocarpa TaxID=122646 RepID=A0ABD3ILM7_9MARC
MRSRIQNHVVEDEVVKAESIPNGHMETIKEDGVTIQICRSGSKSGMFYTILIGEVEMGIASALTHLLVKALRMNGFTQTEIVNFLDMKNGAECGCFENLRLPNVPPIGALHEDLHEEPFFPLSTSGL